MSNTFYIEQTGSEAHMKCLVAIKTQVEAGHAKVTISDKNMARSCRQNRVMHMWFKDIASQSGSSLLHIAGWCKREFFVPVLLSSDSEKTELFKDVWRAITRSYSYEKINEMLASSAFESTSLLSTKEFAQALTEMHAKISTKYQLRDPSVMGLELNY